MLAFLLVNVVLAAFEPGEGAEPTVRDLRGALTVIRGVGPNRKEAGDAALAWKTLAKADVGQLPVILAGMDGASPVARNWLCSAIDEVLERARADKKTLPVEALELFLRDTRHNAQARRLTYELLLELDRTTADRFLPTLLDDPSLELRRDAVARLLDQSEKTFQGNNKTDALPLFQKCLAAARDKDQIDRAVRRLRDLGQKVDLADHLGLILDWRLIGPFPNEKQKGVEIVYPPEKRVDLAAEHDGTAGKLRWTTFVSKDETGLVDLRAGLGDHAEAIGYAVTEFTSRDARDVEVRLGCYTEFKLWLNGELILDRGDALTGMKLDHYVAKGRLKAGKNEILLKVCRTPPGDPIPNHWRFLLRVCDDSGAAILSTTRPAIVPAEKKS